jgi:hypothetical protein
MSNFDPTEHTVAEVNEHLAKSDPDEQARVMDLERNSKNRATVTVPAADASSEADVEDDSPKPLYTVPPGGVPASE